MKKTLFIIKHEFRGMLKRTSYILTTVLLPLVALLAIVIFNLVQSLSGGADEVKIPKIGYIDQVGIFIEATEQPGAELIAYGSVEMAKIDLIKGDIKEYFIIPEDYIANGVLQRYSLKTEIEPGQGSGVAIKDFLIANLLKDEVSADVSARVQSPYYLNNTVLDKSGNVAEGQGGFGAYILSYLFAILLTMSIFTASGFLLQGLTEEKENRVMEVLLSSVSSRQLITGKVLGLGAAGLVQIVIWLVSFRLLLPFASSSIGGLFTTLEFPPAIVALCLVYFILGYLLYAILMAGIGAVAPTVQMGQQMSAIFSMISAIPFVLMVFIIENGDHVVNIVLSLFPLTAPLTVIMRLGQGIPVWEIIASIALLVLGILGSLALAARVFRTFLLMYGKTPGFKEVWRSLRQA
jgi:ABC-2 type transport system permease protein